MQYLSQLVLSMGFQGKEYIHEFIKKCRSKVEKGIAYAIVTYLKELHTKFSTLNFSKPNCSYAKNWWCNDS